MKKNLILIEFNNKVIDEIPVTKDKKFHWVKVPGKIITTPGQWSLLVINQEGTVLLDRMIMTEDPDLIPE